jgi:hypothetical protein
MRVGEEVGGESDDEQAAADRATKQSGEVGRRTTGPGHDESVYPSRKKTHSATSLGGLKRGFWD